MSFTTGGEAIDFGNSDSGNSVDAKLILSYVADTVMCRIPSFTVTKNSATNVIELKGAAAFSVEVQPISPVTFTIPINKRAGFCFMTVNTNNTITLNFTSTGEFMSGTVPQVYLSWTAFFSQP